MSACDICNQRFPRLSRQYTAGQMRTAVRAGYRPPQAVIDAMAGTFRRLGLPEETFLNQWIGRVMSDTTDWMLCDSCHADVDSALKTMKPVGFCVFCKQPIHPKDQIAMLNEVALSKLVSIGAVLHPGPPSGRDREGTPRWVSCTSCMENNAQRARRLGG